MPTMTPTEIETALAEDAEAPSPLPPEEPACHVCGGPLVDGTGRALPAPRLHGRMPVRARLIALRSSLCCKCAGCGYCYPTTFDHCAPKERSASA